MEFTIKVKELTVSFDIITMSYINIVLNKMYNIKMYYGDEHEFNREQIESMSRYLLKNKEQFSNTQLLELTVQQLEKVAKAMQSYEKAKFTYC